MDPVYCSSCTSLFEGRYVPAVDILPGAIENVVKFSIEGWKTKLQEESDSEKGPEPFLHHTLNGLAESSQNCALCALIYEQCIRRPGYEAYMQEERIGIPMIQSDEESRGELMDLAFFYVQREGSRLLYDNIHELMSLITVDMESRSAQETWLSKYSREDSVKRMKLWLETPRPTTGFPARLPTRMLSISKNSSEDTSLEVKLVETADLSSSLKFAALSHPWGSRQPPRLLMSLVDEFKSDIPFAMLPATFQDAIELSWSLDIPYLWIDSLCIIQDSKEDWQNEAALMASVYAQAHATISATGADDPFTGLKQDSLLKIPVVFSPTWTGFEDSKLQSRHLRIINRDQYAQQVLKRPFFRRGWVYQEYVLSPRTIYCARDQLWWSSNSDKVGYMCNETCAGYKFDILRDVILTIPLERLYNMEIDASDDSQYSPRTVWSNLLEDYTTRQFTFESDRLIAFAGIVSMYRHLAQVPEEDYFAGLWRHRMLQDLLWTTRGGKKVSSPLPYRAPSWSWASMEPFLGGSTSNFTFGYMDEIFQAESELEPRAPPVVSVKDVQVTTPGSRLGSVINGYLILHGPLIRAHLSTHEIDMTGRFPPNVSAEFFPYGVEKYVKNYLYLHPSQKITEEQAATTNDDRTEPILDETFPPPTSERSTVYLALFNYQWSSPGGQRFRGHSLVLQRTAAKGEYSRLGYARLFEDILHEKVGHADFSDYVQLDESEYLSMGDRPGFYDYRVV